MLDLSKTGDFLASWARIPLSMSLDLEQDFKSLTYFPLTDLLGPP